ncbi:MAG TPA: glucose 1-dehydrogenase [Rubrobacter sp.]|nr:glucose 1-dehydrogenase [Rubrobacter sp.]
MTTADYRTTGLLSEKVILITGASTGIGADAARVFAREGASVMLAARSEDRLSQLTDEITSNGGRAGYVVCDVSSPEDVQRMVDGTVDIYGRLDGAFNNAGISRERGSALADLDEERFDELVAVNLKGVWLAMRAEIRAMLAAAIPGAIVNTSSVGGLGGGAGLSTYSATKHGVIGLTRSAAHDYGANRIRINAIGTGTTDTEMIAAWRRREPDISSRLNALTPLGRGADPLEVAEAAAWLLSDRASYVSGAVLPVDGGMMA